MSQGGLQMCIIHIILHKHSIYDTYGSLFNNLFIQIELKILLYIYYEQVLDNMSEKMRWAFQATLKIYFEPQNTYDDDVHNQLTTTCWVVTLWLVSKPFFFVTCFIHGVKFKRTNCNNSL